MKIVLAAVLALALSSLCRAQCPPMPKEDASAVHGAVDRTPLPLIQFHPADPNCPDWREMPFGAPKWETPVCAMKDHDHWDYWRCFGYITRPPDSALRSNQEFVFGRYTPKATDKKFWLLTAASIAMIVADEENTQRCIRAMTCAEGNPLLGRTRAQGYAVSGGLGAFEIWGSWKLRGYYRTAREDNLPPKTLTREWWLPQIGIIGFHAVGIALTGRIKR